jgi:hypothetical protein
VPLISFTPNKARLVLEEGKESVLVMKVVLAKGESVELANGGKLQAHTGILRVRERKAERSTGDGKGVGSLVFVDAAQGAAQESASFQINISMSTKKFDALLNVAISGRLPSKFFIEAGERVSRTETRGISYRAGPSGRAKIWDNKSFASVVVTNFTAILPITIPERALPPSSPDSDRPSGELPASYAQVSDLAEELTLFRSETHYTLMVIVSLFAVIALLILLYNLARLFL